MVRFAILTQITSMTDKKNRKNTDKLSQQIASFTCRGRKQLCGAVLLDVRKFRRFPYFVQ